jgi:hypothetical protein
MQCCLAGQELLCGMGLFIVFLGIGLKDLPSPNEDGKLQSNTASTQWQFGDAIFVCSEKIEKMRNMGRNFAVLFKKKIFFS